VFSNVTPVEIANTIPKEEPIVIETEAEFKYLAKTSSSEDDKTMQTPSTKKRRIECPICKMYVDQSELEYHINLHVLNIQKSNTTQKSPKYPVIEIPPDKNGKKRYQCQFGDCRAILKKVQVHMVGHRFSQNIFYLINKRIFQAKHYPEMKMHMCNICGETFLQKITLEQHMNNHANFIPFQCDQCPKKFRRKPHLYSHIRDKHQHQRFVW
jgi:Zinc finger, C2H2 type